MANKFDNVRNQFMGEVQEMIKGKDYEVLITGSNEICIPITNEERDEGYMTITFTIRKGSRDGEAYNGYDMAKDYEMKVKAKEAKKAEAERKKAEKIERDRKAREEKARIKAERNKEKEE